MSPFAIKVMNFSRMLQRNFKYGASSLFLFLHLLQAQLIEVKDFGQNLGK
jgi:hypothetical protein